MLRTAIDLKEAIENVDNSFRPIGSIPLDIVEWKLNKYGIEDDDKDEDKMELFKCVEQLRQSLNPKYTKQFNLDTLLTSTLQTLPTCPLLTCPLKIKLNDVVYSGSFDVPQEKLKELYKQADVAGFGDVKSQKTVIDTSVRKAKHITSEHFTVSDDVINLIRSMWNQQDDDGYLYPRNVTVVPYKINLYGEGGHFVRHQDTPDKDMVGTAVLALSKSYGSVLKISPPNSSDPGISWDQKPGDCIMFYTDCPHEVSYGSWNEIRGTIAFKIFYNTVQENNNEENKDCENGNDEITINKTVEYIQKLEKMQNEILEKQNFGFFLGHGYSLETETFKGKDHILISALNKLDKKYIVIPVVHKWYLSGDTEMGEVEASSNVYPFTESHIDYILSNKDKPVDKVGDVQFYRVNGTDYVWKDDHQDAAEFTGNESRAEEQNSIYLSRAIIIL